MTARQQVQIEMFRHYLGALGGESLGSQEVSADPVGQARRLFDGGVRKVVFAGPVRLDEPGSRAALDLLRELAAWGVRCEWRASGRPPAWQAFSHLPPPSGGADLDPWRAAYFPAKCVFREGPGFVQIRDRRSGSLECYTVEESELIAAVRRLAAGADPDACDPAATSLFAEHGLLVRAGGLRWWAPARLRRWPVPAMVV
ncbi:DUF5825 family protein [Saccharopolyspora shandongensis]|uniref:DUF5825 family protein n=1 Tax=Saccharopolyspora shandongensis TaxID=418495 RepID=UPI0033D5D95D